MNVACIFFSFKFCICVFIENKARFIISEAGFISAEKMLAFFNVVQFLFVSQLSQMRKGGLSVRMT